MQTMFPTLGASVAGMRYFGDFERFAAISAVAAEKLDGVRKRIHFHILFLDRRNGSSVFVLLRETRFPLMPNGKNQNGVLVRLTSVEGDVTGASARYHQLMHCRFHRAPDQRMTHQQSHRLLDQSNCFRRSRRIGLDQEIGQSFEIGKRLLRINQLCQDFVFGRAALSPATRASR